MENSVKLLRTRACNSETDDSVQRRSFSDPIASSQASNETDEQTADEKTDLKDSVKIEFSNGKHSQTPAMDQHNDKIPNGCSNQGFSQTESTATECQIELEIFTRVDETGPNSCISVVTSEPKQHPSQPTSCIESIVNSLRLHWQRHRDVKRRAIIITLTSLYLAYFAYSMYYRFGDEDSILLLVMTSAVAVGLTISALKNRFRSKISNRLKLLRDFLNRHGSTINWIFVLLIIVSVVVFIIVDVIVVSKNTYNLVSASGILVYVLLLFLFSKHRSKIRWKTILWGFALQMIFAVCILRTEAGYKTFEWLGSRVTDFISFSDEGSKFVFGEPGYLDHFFVFKVMPTVIFFSTTVSVLYHLGVMQFVITKIAWVMQVTMGTTAGESLTAAANIFIGQSEAPLLIGPLLPDMTSSELHAVMTGGFATITGGIMAAYILLGVPANHLISASVMSAPAALAMSKLIHPETEESKTTVKHLKKALQERPDGNVIGALSRGATLSIKIVAGVIVNLIAFIATLHFLNAVLTWFGQRAGVNELTFQMVCSYVLWPFAFVMGVEFQDCRRVAQLIGIKTVLNEFIAYKELVGYIDNRKLIDAHVSANGSWYSNNDVIYLVDGVGQGNATVLTGGILTHRSITIATYALCGFSNISSMGILLGTMASMAPLKRNQMAEGVVTAMIAGSIACFITACIAGLFYTQD